MSNIFDKQPRKAIPLQDLKKFKIVSTDGTADTTKLYYNDEELEGVGHVSITIDAETNMVMGTFTVLGPICNLEIPQENIQLQKDPTFPGDLPCYITDALKNELSTVSKENLDQDSVT